MKRTEQQQQRECVFGERKGKGKEVKRWESEEWESRENDGVSVLLVRTERGVKRCKKRVVIVSVGLVVLSDL